jgi:hypothetical protein
MGIKACCTMRIIVWHVIGHERRREEGTCLHRCLVGWLVGWFACLFVGLFFFILNFFWGNFSPFLKLWRKTWKHLFITNFFGNVVLLFSAKL